MNKHIQIYKDFLFELMSDQLYDMGDNARINRSKNIIITYKGVQQRTSQNKIKTIKFDTVDPNGSGKTWRVLVQIPDYRLVSKGKKSTIKEKLELAILAGDIKVECVKCPDYKFKGFQYIGTEMNYSIHPETIPPTKTNPNLEGSLCKHALAVVNKLSDFIDVIADDIKNYNKKQ